MDENKDIYKILFDNSGQGMIVCDKRGIIELLNPMACKMFGYSKKELIKKPIELLVPKKMREKHVRHRDEYNQHPMDRQMGGNMDLLGMRKDSSVFSVEVGLNHCEING